MDIRVRPASPADVGFARALYFETMRGMIESIFGWDQARQEQGFANWFDVRQAAIIVADGHDIGWLQTREDECELFLGSLYVVPKAQRLGIGTHVLRELIARAERSSKAMTLAVMKINPAIRLYERLGFRVTHEDQYKFYMRVHSTTPPS